MIARHSYNANRIESLAPEKMKLFVGIGLSRKVDKNTSWELARHESETVNYKLESQKSGKLESEIIKGSRKLRRQDLKNRKSSQQAYTITCTTRPKD